MVKTQQILILALVVILLPGINESFVIKYDNQLFNLFSCHISSKEISMYIPVIGILFSFHRGAATTEASCQSWFAKYFQYEKEGGRC